MRDVVILRGEDPGNDGRLWPERRLGSCILTWQHMNNGVFNVEIARRQITRVKLFYGALCYESTRASVVDRI